MIWSVGLEDDSTSIYTKTSWLETSEGYEVRRTHMAYVGVLASHVDYTFLEQIARAVVVNMSNVVTLTTLVALTTVNNMVELVCLMKSMREMSCEHFLG